MWDTLCLILCIRESCRSVFIRVNAIVYVLYYTRPYVYEKALNLISSSLKGYNSIARAWTRNDQVFSFLGFSPFSNFYFSLFAVVVAAITHILNGVPCTEIMHNNTSNRIRSHDNNNSAVRSSARPRRLTCIRRYTYIYEQRIYWPTARPNSSPPPCNVQL